MIKSFRGKETAALFAGASPRRFRAIQSVAERKLAHLDAAVTLNFLRAPPGNRLEALSGPQRSTQHPHQRPVESVLRFENGDAFDVEIVDYH